MKKTVLIVDDEKSIRQSLKGILQDEGFETIEAADGETAIKITEQELPDLILLDIWMPGIDGLETLKRIKERFLHPAVIMISGHGTIETAVSAIKLGAYDFIEKPLSLDKTILTINHALEVRNLQEENKLLRQRIFEKYTIIGHSPRAQSLMEQIKIVAPTRSCVLILGENGVGKELAARQIHLLSPRKNMPFIEVNCAAIPEDLIESELFGYEKGAFTGAITKKKGKFDLAHQGTLFLDEIGDMSLKTQSKILRILEEKRFERVGGSNIIEVDVRIIAATNKDLRAEIKKGNFREDLYFRINVIPLEVPPLRERKEDIPLLVEEFLQRFSLDLGKEVKSVSPEVMEVFKAYPWPGNVRELKNLAERLVILSRDRIITLKDLPSYLYGEEPEEKDLWELHSFREAREAFEKKFIKKKLDMFSHNISKTAEAIGIERTHLHRRLKSLGLEPAKKSTPSL